MKHFILFTSVAFLSACQPTIDSRGFNLDLFKESDIKIGKDTTTTIGERFGTPSSVSEMSNTPKTKTIHWYYVTQKSSTTAFFKPKLLDQRVVEITFNKKGVVESVRKINSKDMKPVTLSTHKTQSSGYERSTMRDIFGNFGRYSNQAPK